MHMPFPLTTAVAGSIWVGYSLLYTPMKQYTSFNTFFGAIVGSLPPFIGCYAAMGSLMSLETLLLSSYIFSWQWPHFYGILYENKDDYKRAGFKMLSNDDPEGKIAIKHIKFSTVLGSSIPAIMSYTGMISPLILPFYYAYYYKAVK